MAISAVPPGCNSTANRDSNKYREKTREYAEGTPAERAQKMKSKDGTDFNCKATAKAALEDSINDFCSKTEHLYLDPGGGTCLERDISKAIAKDYCSVGNRITGADSGAACTIEYIGNSVYGRLAETYCKTAAGKTDAWCSCYNVIKGVCDTDSTAAGCAKKRQTFDKLVEATPEDYKDSWSQMEPCFGGVCQGNVFQPAGYNSNCNRSVQVCVQDFDFQSMADSQINATCNLTSNRDTQPSAGDGSGTPSYTPSGAPSGTTYPTGSTAATLDTSFRSKLPEFLRPYVPVSIDEVKTDSSKQLGVGGVGSLFMMCCCLLVIIVLATSGGGESGGRSMRFRR